MLGQINKFKVARITDLGYMIEKDKIQYFMHKNDCNNAQYNIGDSVEAFIYKDKKNRLAATTNLPIILSIITIIFMHEILNFIFFNHIT